MNFSYKMEDGYEVKPKGASNIVRMQNDWKLEMFCSVDSQEYWRRLEAVR